MSMLTLIEQSPGHFAVEGSLTFAGIDKQTAKSFKFQKGVDSICIDLAKVKTADSAGLALMIEWIRLSRLNQIRLSFANIPKQLLAIAKLSGLDEYEYFANPAK
jgi:phospholipid transport system transporter-binding protein